MIELTRFTEKDLCDPAQRGAVETYIRSLEEGYCLSEAEYWQARLDNDDARAARALDRVRNPRSLDPVYWQDPEKRTFIQTFIEALRQFDPPRAAWYQAKLDGDEKTAQRLMVQSEVFNIQRVLNETPESDVLGREVVEAWKKSLVERARE